MGVGKAWWLLRSLGDPCTLLYVAVVRSCCIAFEHSSGGSCGPQHTQRNPDTPFNAVTFCIRWRFQTSWRCTVPNVRLPTATRIWGWHNSFSSSRMGV